MLTESSIASVGCLVPRTPWRITRHHQNKEDNLKAGDPKYFQKEHCWMQYKSQASMRQGPAREMLKTLKLLSHSTEVITGRVLS